MLMAELKKANYPGSVIAVIHAGKIIYKTAYGLADVERSVPLTTKSVFDVASISKQFVATCILLLENRKKLSLEDPIQQYIPEMPHKREPQKLKHLLYHMSGVKDYLDLMEAANMPTINRYTKAEMKELIMRSESLESEPGQEFSYSNSGYFLLTEVVEVLSEKPLSVFADEMIFKPLGMLNTLYLDDCYKVVQNRALSYLIGRDGEVMNYPYIFDIVGDTGLLTTIDDLFLWDQNFYNNRLDGNSSLIARLLKRGQLNNGQQINYACGLFLDEYKGLPVVGHSGGAAGYRSNMFRFPEQEFSVISLSNYIGMKQIVDSIADIYLYEFMCK